MPKPLSDALPTRNPFTRLVRALGPALGLLAVWLLFAFTVSDGRFTHWPNQQLMLLQTAVVGTAAVGATLIIISKGLDLSVGSTVALATMVMAWVCNRTGSPALSACAGILTGALVGTVVGAAVVGHIGRVVAIVGGVALVVALWGDPGPWVALPAGLGACALALLASTLWIGRVELSPFIVTLGMLGVLRGAAKGLGDNQPIYASNPGWLSTLMDTNAPGMFSFLPPGVLVFLSVASFGACLLRFTVLGRRAFAIGSNQAAARYAGVPVARTKLFIYALGVGCAGVAAVLQFSYVPMGDPTAAGGLELKVIAAVVIGGASLSGGTGTVLGTLIGALLMTVIDNGCTKLGLANWVQEVVTGAIIVGAVVLDRVRNTARDVQ